MALHLSIAFCLYLYNSASTYDIRIAGNADLLRLNPEKADVLKFTSVPKKPGELENYSSDTKFINRNKKPTMSECGAVDDNQNIGEMSNIISISVITDPKWIPPTPEDPFPILIVIIFGVVALLVVSLVITCIVCICKKKRGCKSPVSYDNRAYTDTESKY